MDHAYFQRKVKKFQIQDKFRSELNLGHVSETKDCPEKFGTDDHGWAGGLV